MTYRNVQASQVLRRVCLSPYRKGHGPTFALTTWDTYRTDHMGKSVLGYRLTMREPGRPARELFCGEDFACSPVRALDSDACVASLLGFLTLRPGDTDSDYFAGYSPEQLEFCDQWAEELQAHVTDRFDPSARE